MSICQQFGKDCQPYWKIKFLLVLLATIFTGCNTNIGGFYDTGVADDEYIAIAKTAEEASDFLQRYPMAEIFVDRSSRLAVDFRVTLQPVSNTNQEWRGVRLRVFIDPRTNLPADVFLQCDHRFVKKEIHDYLDQYQKTLSCP